MLIDAGPLIALFDRHDKYHRTIVDFLRNRNLRLVSTWPMLTEVAQLLDFSVQAQLDLLRQVHRGGLDVHQLSIHDLERIIALTGAYHDRPMHLADASLIVVAKHRGMGEIISTDRDFDIYRTQDKNYVRNVFKQPSSPAAGYPKPQAVKCSAIRYTNPASYGSSGKDVAYLRFAELGQASSSVSQKTPKRNMFNIYSNA